MKAAKKTVSGLPAAALLPTSERVTKAMDLAETLHNIVQRARANADDLLNAAWSEKTDDYDTTFSALAMDLRHLDIEIDRLTRMAMGAPVSEKEAH